MGIREKLNDNPKLALGAGAGGLAIALVFLVSQFTSGGGPSEKGYFTTDDGQTWFADDVRKIPPFQRDGKDAVRAYVYECNGKQFVNHLERFTPKRQKAMEAAAEAAKTGAPLPAGHNAVGGQEVKRPGAKEWISTANLAKAGPILQARCPDGKGDAQPVEP